ncbi:MAG: ribose 5-phosphate isomerase B [Myxococcaceae bacterium]
MKLSIASDHAGLDLKNELVAHLKEKNVPVEDLGVTARDSVDYPDYAKKVAERVSGTGDFGILVCGTGIGMSIMANKMRGIRAAVCTSEFEARMARAHNDANVLCLGQRVVGAGVARAVVDAFLGTRFEGGRHATRVQKIDEADKQR